MPIAHVDPAGAASMVLMMNSVEPTRSAFEHHLVRALGVHQDLDAGDPRADVVDGLSR